jgi:hypothetical protein
VGNVVITREESVEILRQVRENHRRLEECPGPHDFKPVERDGITPAIGVKFGMKYRCATCEGVIDGSDKWHYDQGLEHGRKESK